MAYLSALYRYPIKSVAGEALSHARVTEEGLAGDRRFMVVKPDGAFVTARRYPQLQRVVVRCDGAMLSLTHDNYPAIAVRCAHFAGQAFATGVWADTFDAWTTTTALDAWLGRIIGEPVRLLWLGEQSSRYRATIDTRVSFADGYPLLLTTTASLADLNARTDGSHVMAQFRPNIVVDETAAFAEDDWQRLCIGNVVFRVAKPCARCVMVTVDPARGERRPDGEPMQTLATYRRVGKEVLFGQNLIADNTGDITVGDAVEVLD